ncbi:MAG: DUF3299 domain-containing protein [Lysobacteraceae bacterium]
MKFAGTSLWRLVFGALVWVGLQSVAMAEVRGIDWLELIPPEELKEMESQPIVDHNGTPIAPDYSNSHPVLTMNGVEGRIPGYIVPITVTEENTISEFFVVPYFGACIHVPPPPPNQIIYVKPEKPIEMTEIWAAYWIEGKLKLENQANSLGQSSYSMELTSVTPWEG